MRNVPHPVVVVTASDPANSKDQVESAFRGMTISSFNTVTLSPRPYVSFNVKVPSATHSAISRSGFFLVHILSASSSGASIADAFARGANTNGEAFRDIASKATNASNVQIFAGKGTQGAPLLAGDGVSRVLRCKTTPEKQLTVEDHVVLIAEVISIVSSPRSSKDTRESRTQDEELGQPTALLYGNQAYRRWGTAFEAKNSKGTKPETTSDIHKTLGLNVRRGDEIESL